MSPAAYETVETDVLVLGAGGAGLRGAIAAAEQAANAGDKQGVLRHLKNAGKWAADIASKIGVNVASELIKKSMQ